MNTDNLHTRESIFLETFPESRYNAFTFQTVTVGERLKG